LTVAAIAIVPGQFCQNLAQESSLVIYAGHEYPLKARVVVFQRRPIQKGFEKLY